MSRSRAASLAAVAALVCAASAGDAEANGRFPGAGQIALDRESRDRVVVRTTFGLLFSDQRGRAPRWVCEDSAFFGSGSYDPPIVVAPGGVVLAALVGGVSRSADRGCSWVKASGRVDGRYVVDLSLDANGRVIAIALGDFSRGFFAASTDAGQSFAAVDLPEDIQPLTLDAAPSRPSRIYVSGRAAFPQFGAIARSDDAGLTWSLSSFDLKGGRDPYIAAVDPKNPDRLYLRVFGDTDERLMVSDDAGTTFVDLLTTPSFLFGFALSPDGASMAVGTPADGLRIGAASAPLALAPASPVDARCLAWDDRGLLTCASEPKDPFSLGELVGGKAPVLPLHRFADVEPLDCPATTRTGAVCPPLWPDVAASLGRDAGAPAPAADGGGPPDAAAAAAGPATPTVGLGAGGGCSACQIGVRGHRTNHLYCLMIAPLLAFVVRRRRVPSQAAVYAPRKDCY